MVSPSSAVPQENPSFLLVSHFVPSQAEQIPKSPIPLEIPTVALVCIFNQINSIIKGLKKVELLVAILFFVI